MPLIAIVLGALAIGLVLGALLSLLYGAEIKRALGVGVGFACTHLVIALALELLFA